MVAVANKQQTTALCLSTTVTRTRRHTELTNTENPDRKPVLCQRTFSSVFRAVFYTVKLRVYGALHLTLQLIVNNFIVTHFIIPLLGIITKL